MDMFLPENATPQWQYSNSNSAGFPMSQFPTDELDVVNLANPDLKHQPLSPVMYWEPQQISTPSRLWPNEMTQSPTSSTESRGYSFSSTDSHAARPKVEEEVSPRIKRRREQNRKSQRTFRQRQAKHIQELEEKLQTQTSRYERLEELVKELRKRQPDLVESVLDPGDSLLSPPPEDEKQRT